MTTEHATRIDEDGMPLAGMGEAFAPKDAPKPSPIPGCGWAVNCYGARHEDNELGLNPRWLHDPYGFVGEEIEDPLRTPEVDELWLWKPSGMLRTAHSSGRERRYPALPLGQNHYAACAAFVRAVNRAGKRAVLYTGGTIDGVDGGASILRDDSELVRLMELGFNAMYFDDGLDMAPDCQRIGQHYSLRQLGVEPTLPAASVFAQSVPQCALHRYPRAPWHTEGASGLGRRISIVIDGTKFGPGNVVERNALEEHEVLDLVRRRWKLVGLAINYRRRVVDAVRHARNAAGGGG